MKLKNKLNCYLFSNLIISILTMNFYVNNNSRELVAVSNNNKLNKIYEIEEVNVKDLIESVEVTNVVVSSKPVQSNNNINYVKPSYNALTGANLVEYAKYYLGLPYVYGGNSLTNGTDCSGFTKLIYQEFGINLGRTVSSQIYNGTYVSKSDLQPGDLVFYGYSDSATHVAIYLGNGLVIHESNPRDGVKINTVDMMVYITARRVITADIIRSVEIPNTENQVEETETKEIDEEITDEIDEEIQEVDNNLEDDQTTEDNQALEEPIEEITDLENNTIEVE